MRIKKHLWLILVLLGTLVFSTPLSWAADAPAKIKAGLMFGMTGAASPIGPVQLDGAKLALKEINEAGGVKLGGKKVPIEFEVRDDETKVDVSIRRFRELVNDQKVHFVVGSTFASIAAALNEETKRLPVVYLPVNVAPITSFPKSEMAETAFCMHGNDYSIGYAGASYIVNKLGHKNVFFFAPAYGFGWNQWKGAKDALEKFGAKYEYMEAPVGTADFTSYLLKIEEKKPDIVMMAQWGTDAIGVLKQAYETGLKKKTKIWFNWMTNVFGSGVPADAIEGVNSLMSWYYDMTGFGDQAIVNAAKEFTDKFTKEYKYPPDPYSAAAYMAVKEAARAIENAQSVDPKAISKAILSNPKFDSMRGPGTWRVDHQPLFKYGAFVVVGKGEKERKDKKWDLVKIVGAYTGDDYIPAVSTFGY
jgi:branched-chain amino acid transport system substrate-binding protein